MQFERPVPLFFQRPSPSTDTQLRSRPARPLVAGGLAPQASSIDTSTTGNATYYLRGRRGDDSRAQTYAQYMCYMRLICEARAGMKNYMNEVSQG